MLKTRGRDRLLCCEDAAWMPKFSLPVRITNSKREPAA